MSLQGSSILAQLARGRGASEIPRLLLLRTKDVLERQEKKRGPLAATQSAIRATI